MMENLNALELALLDGLVQKYPNMEAHLPHLRVSKRELTSTGLCIYIDYHDFAEEVTPLMLCLVIARILKFQD